MDNALIHIGLFKSGSTFLQQAWAGDSRVHLICEPLLPVVAAARDIANNKPPEMAEIFLNLEENKINILSHESLSTAFIDEKTSLEKIRLFQDISAEIIFSLTGKSKILLVLREPVSWILSTYNQVIKQGGTLTFPQFLNAEKNYLTQMLNPDELVNTWAKYNDIENVLFMPFELLRDDQQSFFSILSEFCGAPQPTPAILQGIRTNPSLKTTELNVMRGINHLINIFNEYGILNNAAIPSDYTDILTGAGVTARLIMEDSPPKLQRFVRVLERNCKDCRADQRLIDPLWLQDIRARFSELFGDSDFFGYRERYTG